MGARLEEQVNSFSQLPSTHEFHEVRYEKKPLIFQQDAIDSRRRKSEDFGYEKILGGLFNDLLFLATDYLCPRSH